MSLQKYKHNRKFDDTPEPAGAKRSSSGHLRFVIQKHEATRLHYDFRLELDGVLKSWAVPKGPSLNTADKRLAMMVEDHPYDYKDFEGTIPAGNYGAGTVMIWDEGTYHALGETDPKQSVKLLRDGLKSGMIKFFLEGEKLRGGFALIKMKPHGRGEQNSWLLIKEKDDYVVKTDVTKLETSARTDRTMDEIAKNRPLKNEETEGIAGILKDADGLIKAKMPRDVSPMLSTLVEEPFDKEDWVYEIKWDGFRAVAEVEKKGVRLYSRNKLSFNELFAPVVKELRELPFEAVLDGEVVVLDPHGKSSFQLLQNYQNTGSGQLTYYVFDLLYLNGHSLCGLPLSKRKQILKAVLPDNDILKYSDHVEGEGIKFFELAQKQGLEGIIAKNAMSQYKTGKRTSDWLKIKTHMRQEAVIGGFTEPRGSRKKLGALVLGVYEGDELVYIGHTGSGFGEKTLSVLHGKLEKLKSKESPFKAPPKTNAPVTWVKPQLVCEVAFAEWTMDGSMRQPIFQGLRPDKKPKEVTKEKPKEVGKAFDKNKPKKKDEIEVRVGNREVKLTHLSKVYWPKEKYTKGDLVEYYRDVAPIMLPYLKDRPENLNRHPHGITGESFYQKDVTYDPPSWVKTKKIYSETNKAHINYMVCQDEATLVYMANLGCIEINPWNSRIQNLEKPDYMVIDLDPEDIKFDKVVEAALVVHKILDKLVVPNYCKTSGATGLHIYIPLAAKYEYELAKEFAQLIATMVHAQLPKTTSMERSPSKRQKQIYLDYLQNRKGQTLAAPYSVRPKPGATVSTPLEWKEVNKKLDPRNFTIKNTLKRLEKKGDLFKPVLGKGVDIEKIISKLGKN